MLRPVAALLLVPWLALAAGNPADQLPDPALEARARAIGTELRCLICQNQSIEDSEADIARDLRRLVREQLAGGATDREVIGFVHARYGDFVLLRPPLTPVTVVLWAVPALVLALGLWLLLRRRRARPEAAPLSAAERARLAELEAGEGG
jgi:cytochrome c-type biogenesis protein CcmH